jgi:lysophospholipase L1-like esterase
MCSIRKTRVPISFIKNKRFMLQQLLYFLGSILIMPLLPILLYLGKKVRKSVPELPEASDNLIGTIAGNQGDIQLLTIGESTIAGVGVRDHRDGITGGIAKNLRDLSQKSVHWQVLARNGYTAERVNQMLVPMIQNSKIDIIVIGLGGNDTFQFNSPLTFRKHLITTIKNIQLRQPTAKIIIANMPPIGEFPAFPWIIQRILGSLVSLHGSVIRDVPTLFNNVFYVDKTIRFDDWLSRTNGQSTVHDFFSDGVHPSAMTYGIWGEEIGKFIVQNTFKKDPSV